MDEACFTATTVAREISFQGGERIRAEVGDGEDLAEFGWFF